MPFERKLISIFERVSFRKCRPAAWGVGVARGAVCAPRASERKIKTQGESDETGIFYRRFERKNCERRYADEAFGRHVGDNGVTCPSNEVRIYGTEAFLRAQEGYGYVRTKRRKQQLLGAGVYQ